jgi:hypothetical protein
MSAGVSLRLSREDGWPDYPDAARVVCDDRDTCLLRCGRGRNTLECHLKTQEQDITMLEFLFCPVHGLFSPRNIGLTGMLIGNLGYYARALLHYARKAILYV